MKNRIWTKIAAGIVIATAVLMSGCDGKTLELTGYVTEVHDTPAEPCEFIVIKNQNHEEDWPIEVNGEFKLEKHGDIYKFVVKGDPESVLGKVDMVVVNEKERALRYDYCNGGGPVSEHPYLVGITELDQTYDPPRLRAFVYFPMRWRYNTPETSADAFYLMLMVVEEAESDCEHDESFLAKVKAAESGAEAAAEKTTGTVTMRTAKANARAAANVAMGAAPGAASERFISTSEVRCKALQRLGALYREQATPGKFRKAVKAEIQNILPDHPAFVPGFHNGVIHGNF